MRVLQADPSDRDAAIGRALALRCDAVAWTLDDPTAAGEAAVASRRAGLAAHGWLQAARDEAAAHAHPEWMHCPQHHEWLRCFPEYAGGHPALVAPYIGLNTAAAFDHARGRVTGLIRGTPWAERVWLGDIQGPPMGCGCGNPCCRSWDNAPGPKLASTPYDRPEVLFPLEFYAAVAGDLPGRYIIPVLCPECERGVTIRGAEDPDGPDGTDLCQGVACSRPCALDYWPALLRASRGRTPEIGLLLLTTAFGKDHSVYGESRAWAASAHQHYGADLIPCLEPEDAARFEGTALFLTDAPQDCRPVSPPPGYIAEVPPILCGYCPPASPS